MTALSYSQGHQIEWVKNNWLYKDTGKPITENRSCKKCGKYPVIMKINKEKCEIDYCIAPIIKALNNIGLSTMFCCCGHGEEIGTIQARTLRLTKRGYEAVARVVRSRGAQLA